MRLPEIAASNLYWIGAEACPPYQQGMWPLTNAKTASPKERQHEIRAIEMPTLNSSILQLLGLDFLYTIWAFNRSQSSTAPGLSRAVGHQTQISNTSFATIGETAHIQTTFMVSGNQERCAFPCVGGAFVTQGLARETAEESATEYGNGPGIFQQHPNSNTIIEFRYTLRASPRKNLGLWIND